jgi:hypothetical protein
MNLLAAINRKVAAKTSTVSPHCHVSYINADDSTSPTSRSFTQSGESVPFEMPVLLFGIDLTDMTRAFHEGSAEFFRTKDATTIQLLDEAAINEGLKRRP